jgi:hypothetical protein
VFSPFSSPLTPYAIAVSLQATYRDEDEEEDESRQQTPERNEIEPRDLQLRRPQQYAKSYIFYMKLKLKFITI